MLWRVVSAYHKHTHNNKFWIYIPHYRAFFPHSLKTFRIRPSNNCLALTRCLYFIFICVCVDCCIQCCILYLIWANVYWIELFLCVTPCICADDNNINAHSYLVSLHNQNMRSILENKSLTEILTLSLSGLCVPWMNYSKDNICAW